MNGCENDMNRLSEWIQDRCHFENNDIKKLTSTSTKMNIMNELKDIIGFAKNNNDSELWYKLFQDIWILFKLII